MATDGKGGYIVTRGLATDGKGFIVNNRGMATDGKGGYIVTRGLDVSNNYLNSNINIVTVSIYIMVILGGPKRTLRYNV